MNKNGIILFYVLFFYILIVTGIACAASLEIKSTAEVVGSEIRVSDVIGSSIDVPRQILEMSLGNAPAPGQERIIPKSSIQNATRDWTGAGAIEWTGATQCKVSRPGRLISMDDLRGLIESALQKRAGTAGRIKVLEFGDEKSFMIPAGNSLVEIEFSPTVMSAEWTNAMLRFSLNNQTIAAKSIRFHWSLETEVWKANRALQVGDPIKAEYFSPFTCNAFDMNGPAFTGDISSLDAVAARPLMEGGILSIQHIRTRTLVKRGTPVIVNYHVGSITVKMSGTALDNGSKGQLVSVRNNDSKKRIFAKVVDEGVLEYVQ